MKKILSLCLVALLSFSAQAEWKLNNDQSAINFVSIKKSNVGEVHSFKSLAGSIKNGEVKVNIDLSSVETNIPIRNERMQNMLFNISQYTSAAITTKIDTSKLDKLKAGQHYQEKLNLTLNLHGVINKISTTVNIVKLSNDSVFVHSVYPVILKASDYGLAKGIEALRVIAKLPAISTAVPVTFSLIFSK